MYLGKRSAAGVNGKMGFFLLPYTVTFACLAKGAIPGLKQEYGKGSLKDVKKSEGICGGVP